MPYLLLFFSVYMAGVRPKPAPEKARLQVAIHNVQSLKGAVFIALFKPGVEFPDGRPMDGKRVDATAATVHAAFMVEPGKYAIAVFHDENSNGKMDKRLFGIPKEPYGLSNNFRPRFSAPKFNDCQFNVNEGVKTVSINLDKF